MRMLAIVLSTAGVLLLAFGWWGTHPAAAQFGRGFIPIAAGSAGGLLLIAAVIADLVAERNRRKTANDSR